MLKPAVFDTSFSLAHKTFFFEPQTDGVIAKSPSITVEMPTANFLLGTRHPRIKLLAVVHSAAGKELARGSFVLVRNARGNGTVVTVDGFADVPGTASVRIAQIAAAFGDELGVLARTLKTACDTAIAAIYGAQKARSALADAQAVLSERLAVEASAVEALAVFGVQIVEVDG